MGKFAGVLIMGVLLLITLWGNAGAEKPKGSRQLPPVAPSQPAAAEQPEDDPLCGVWEAKVKRSPESVEVTQRIEFRKGRMVYTRPNDSAGGEPGTSIRVEAEYIFVEGAPLQGKVLSATGETAAVKGDTFSLGWEIDKERLALVDAKGRGLEGVSFGKVFWTRKP